MSDAKPTVGEHMTLARHSVAPTDTLVTAKDLMELHAIRHLPVVAEGRVVGMVTMSDLYVMEATFSFDPDKTRVASAMSSEVYAVQTTTPLATVAGEMATRHIGSALVMDGERLIGVFTTTDACRVLAEVLRAAP